MIHNLNKKGYILDRKGQIEEIKYRDYLREFGSDETTTPRGVAPRLYIEGNSIMSWGVRGNNHHFHSSYKNNREAVKALFEIWENNVLEGCDIPQFYGTQKEMFQDIADCYSKDWKVVYRYFRLQKFNLNQQKQSKLKHDNRLIFTKEMMIDFINNNKEMVISSINELDELKALGNKAVWQVKANSLIQKVSNNDFRFLNWKEVYNLIRESIN